MLADKNQRPAQHLSFSVTLAIVRALKGVESVDQIKSILSEATRAFKIAHFALIQRLSQTDSAGPIHVTNFPEEWIEHMWRDRRLAEDPVLMASERTVAAFTWRELPTLMKFTERQTIYMAAARDRGLCEGFTVPIHVPGEATGLCSFVADQHRALPIEALPAMQYVACFAFEAARRLTIKPTRDESVLLTHRQLDCVVLAAQGKSNWVVGKLLGLSQQTVHKYLENAKRRYGVSSRTELVVRALFNGQLSFTDVIH